MGAFSCLSVCIVSSHHAASHEVHEGRWCQGHDQGHSVEDHRHRARPEDQSLLQCVEQPGGRGDEGSEEGGCLHHPRSLPHQDPNQASHQGLREDDVRQGDQGEGETSQDRGESLPSGSSEEANLGCCGLCAPCTSTLSEVWELWESHSLSLK